PWMGTSRSDGVRLSAKLLEAFRITTLDKGVGGLPEEDAFMLELAREPFMLVDTHACVEREVGTDAQEHAAPFRVAQIEVVQPHEPGADLDAVAARRSRIADGASGGLAALEDDRDAEARAEALIERLDPVLAPDTFGRLDDRDALRCCQTSHKAVVVLGDLAEVGPGDRRHLPALVEEADDHRRLLHGLNDGVEQHTIEARVLKADALLVVLDERVHGGPPDRWLWTLPS